MRTLTNDFPNWLFSAALSWIMTVPAIGQTPLLEWQYHHAPEVFAPGHQVIWNELEPPNNAYTVELDWYTENAPVSTVDGSGKDWLFGVTPVKNTDGHVVAYCGVGYTSFINWAPPNECQPNTNWGYAWPPNNEGPGYLDGIWRVGPKGSIVLFDLDGQVIWRRGVGTGLFHDVTQDSQGNLVVTGRISMYKAYPGDVVSDVIYNKNSSNAGWDLSEELDRCQYNAKAAVVKVDLQGDIQWCNLYGPLSPGETGFDTDIRLRTEGNGIVETSITGQPGYRFVGWTEVTNNVFKPYVVDIDLDGNLIGQEVYHSFPISGYDQQQQGRAWHITRGIDPVSNEEVHAIVGQRSIDTGGGVFMTGGAFLWVLDENGTRFFTQTHEDASYFTDQSITLVDNSQGVTFVESNGALSVVWPVMHDFTVNGVNGTSSDIGVHQAIGRVYRFDLDGTPLWTEPVDIGVIRALDLYFTATQTGDGNVAVTTTKWSPGLGFDTGEQPALYEDIDPVTIAYLNSPSGLGYDLEQGPLGFVPYPWHWWDDRGCPNDPTCENQFEVNFILTQNYYYGYWYTDSYAAKLRLGDGAVIWETSWDGHEGSSDLVWPGNFRQRQCNFDITEAHDGGLIVVGNIGHNMDDQYIAKLGPCDLLADYNGPMLDENNQYILTQSEVWTTDRTIKGSIVIPDGLDLTIQDCTVQFADGRKIGITTNIRVMQGGSLKVLNSTLTSLQGCTESMWDGIIAPRTQGLPASVAHSILISGSTISNALVGVLMAEADPMNPYDCTLGSYHTLLATNSTFTNNRIGVFQAAGRWQGIGFDPWNSLQLSTFETTARLNYPELTPLHHLYMRNSYHTSVYGCTFRNTIGGTLYPDDITQWGEGIRAENSRVRVEMNSVAGTTRNRFEQLGMGIVAASPMPGTVRVDNAEFVNNARGIGLRVVKNARITRNDFLVPDLGMNSAGNTAYGTYLRGCTGFEFEENHFLGAEGTDHPKVGSVFDLCGAEENQFYNNTFDRFADDGDQSAGTIIMRDNGGQTFLGGLKIKCNDYSNTATNDFDVAFTGTGVTVGYEQGGNLDNAAPAGNTFATDYTLNDERHFYVQLGALNTFMYWHHDPGSTTAQIVPESASAPIEPATWYQTTTYDYTKEDACPTQLSDMLIEPSFELAADAKADLELLEEVYGDWTDGGDTEGLKDFVLDPANDSYTVRNQLMLVAPAVSADVWKAVLYDRAPPLNDWHMAQALVANSPLQKKVIGLLENSTVAPYYVQLVKGYQNGGLSMHDLYKADIAQFYGRMATALHDAFALAVEDSLSTDGIDSSLVHLAAMDLIDGEEQRVYLRIAKNDLTGARALLDDLLVLDPDNARLTVLDLMLGHYEAEEDLTDADSTTVAYLQSLAGGEEPGAAEAEAWLMLLRDAVAEDIILPGGPKSVRKPTVAADRLSASPWLQAHPNPSNGPVYIAYQVPEGVSTVELILTDALGRVVHSSRPLPRNGIVELNARELASGVHVATLRFDGIVAGSAKVTIMR